MSTINPGFGRLLAGCGGALLIGSLFMPWSESAAGASQSGWEVLTVSDVLFLITGLFGLAAAITGGRFGFFRRDLSLNGTTDILGLIAGILLAWLIVFDWPSGASRQAGVYLALVAAAAITTGAGDFRVTSLFPRIPEGDRPN
ncbi:MAG: hypothetical protein QOF51_4066 [Chloroflexota bacterium]|nr:hypothetical protein [Chloroflexota bacterium]